MEIGLLSATMELDEESNMQSQGYSTLTRGSRMDGNQIIASAGMLSFLKSGKVSIFSKKWENCIAEKHTFTSLNIRADLDAVV